MKDEYDFSGGIRGKYASWSEYMKNHGNEEYEAYEKYARSLCFGVGNAYVPGCNCKEVFDGVRRRNAHGGATHPQ